MTAQLHALVPGKNERCNIRPCFESLQAIADDIRMAGSRSIDGLLDISAGEILNVLASTQGNKWLLAPGREMRMLEYLGEMVSPPGGTLK